MLHRDEKWLREMHNAGKSISEIADTAGVSKPTIRAAFKKFSIKPRTISEALLIKPSRHKWTDDDRRIQSDKMKIVQANRKAELSVSAKINWTNNRDKIINGIRLAGLARRVPIDIEAIVVDIKNITLRELSLAHGVSRGTIRRRFRSIGVNNIQQYKRLIIDLNRLTRLYETNTQEECGEILGCSTTTIGRILTDAGIDTTIHFGSDFRDKISKLIKERWNDDFYRQKMAKVRASTTRISGLQTKLYGLLDRMGVEYQPEAPIGPFTFDCMITGNPSLLIECNGNYWHSLPHAVRNDTNKGNYIATYHQHNYKLVAIWEHEFDNEERLVSLLKYWLGAGLVVNDFGFKDVTISKIDPVEYKPFLSKYHYLVYYNRGGDVFGAYVSGVLAAVVAFAPLSRQNLPWDSSCTREISRLCIHPQYQVKNFGSWLLSRAISQLPKAIKTLVSYSDTTYNHNGGVYRASNFKLHHEVSPDYWYVTKDGWAIHKKTVYNRAVKLEQTEADYAVSNDLLRVHGKKKLCFVLDR